MKFSENFSFADSKLFDLFETDKIKEDIRYRKGIIKSTGSLVEGVKDGDKIYYDKHAGFNVEVDEKIFLVIKQQDVVIVL